MIDYAYALDLLGAFAGGGLVTMALMIWAIYGE